MKIIEGKDSQQLDVRIRFDSLEEKQAAFRLLAAMHQKLIGLQRDKEYLLRLEDVCFIASSDKRTFYILHRAVTSLCSGFIRWKNS